MRILVFLQSKDRSVPLERNPIPIEKEKGKVTPVPIGVGAAGYRSLYLSHAKRALYHLSYSPMDRRVAGRPAARLYVIRVHVPRRTIPANK